MRPATLAKTAPGVLATAVIGGLASRPAVGLVREPAQARSSTAAPGFPHRLADAVRRHRGGVGVHRRRDGGRGADGHARTYSALLALNLVLNASWSWLFFNRRLLGTSAIAAAALTASSADFTRRSVAERGPSAAPLALYPLWCAFATVLSSRIWWLNRRSD